MFLGRLKYITILLKTSFDCHDHEILIAKLRKFGYWFSLSALKLVHDFSLDKKQRTKVNKTWGDIVLGVPKGSIFCPIFSHVLSGYFTAQKLKFSIKDFFIFCAVFVFILNCADIASFAKYDNTPYVVANSIIATKTSLEKLSWMVLEQIW